MKKRSLLLSAMATFTFAIVSFAQVPSYVPTNGLVGWWPFNGNANDESGNGNNGTVNGATLTTDRFGAVDKAYDFDGVDDFIEILHHPSLNLPNGTINLWYKTNSNNRMSLMNKSNYQDANNENYSIMIGYLFTVNGPTGLAYFSKYNSNCNPSQGWMGPTNSLNFSDGSYHMLTCITGSSEIKIFVDAIQQAAIQAPSASADTCSGSSLRFGVSWAGDMNPYLGDLDDIGIWNRALNQQEITDLYNSTLGLPVSINENSMKLYPNPTNSNITLEVSIEKIGKSYSIQDFSGRTIRDGKISSTQEQIELEHVARGVYYLSIENGSSVIKLVKE